MNYGNDHGQNGNRTDFCLLPWLPPPAFLHHCLNSVHRQQISVLELEEVSDHKVSDDYLDGAHLRTVAAIVENFSPWSNR